jgi:hypothetical protein
VFNSSSELVEEVKTVLNKTISSGYVRKIRTQARKKIMKN